MTGLTETRSCLLCDGVTSINVSDIVPDGLGNNVRLIQIYTDPLIQINRRPILEITVQSTDPSAVQIQTPQLEF